MGKQLQLLSTCDCDNESTNGLIVRCISKDVLHLRLA